VPRDVIFCPLDKFLWLASRDYVHALLGALVGTFG